MNTAVLLSVQPRWCDKIAKNEKSLEIRKTRPKIETPFKCYIYQTKNGKVGTGLFTADGEIMGRSVKNGKVIGEFICDNIRCFGVPYPAFQNELDKSILIDSCCTYYMLHRYAYHDALYGWHISDLQIYDKPKELGEFTSGSSRLTFGVDGGGWRWSGMKRAPQSWCYVEVQHERLSNAPQIFSHSQV